MEDDPFLLKWPLFRGHSFVFAGVKVCRPSLKCLEKIITLNGWNPKNEDLEYESAFQKGDFQVPAVSFRGSKGKMGRGGLVKTVPLKSPNAPTAGETFLGQQDVFKRSLDSQCLGEPAGLGIYYYSFWLNIWDFPACYVEVNPEKFGKTIDDSVPQACWIECSAANIFPHHDLHITWFLGNWLGIHKSELTLRIMKDPPKKRGLKFGSVFRRVFLDLQTPSDLRSHDS